MEPIYYDIWIMDYMNEYFEKLERKYYAGKLSHKQFSKSLEKMGEWEQHYVDQFGYKYYDPEEEEE
ncbi:MAG: hypothetical protein ACE3JP_03975 [Ectobacillus sp.]